MILWQIQHDFKPNKANDFVKNKANDFVTNKANDFVTNKANDFVTNKAWFCNKSFHFYFLNLLEV